MPAVHRHSDERACGATTVVSGNGTVYANNLLVSVNGDPNTHGDGTLIAGSNRVFVQGIAVVNNSADGSNPDALCIPLGGAHCAPVTAGGSPNVFVGD
jgi:uncharacterized Zn-binding protein involved in type VI secretion